MVRAERRARALLRRTPLRREEFSVALGLALGCLGILVTSRGEVGAPPEVLGMLALGLLPLFGLALLRVPRLWSPSTLALFCFLLAGVAVQDFLRPGVTRAHDLQHHAWAYWSLYECILDGDLWPRWNPYLGLGIPLLSFYSPLGYAAGWPAQLLGASPLQAMTWVLWLGQVFAGGAAIASVRALGGRRGGALVAGVAVVLAPYHLLDQTFRLALGETLAFGLFPPLFASTWLVIRPRSEGSLRPPLVLGSCLVLLLLTHLLSLVMALFGMALIVLLALLPGGLPSAQQPPEPQARASRLRVLGLTGLLAAGVSAAWWAPVVMERDATSVDLLARPGRTISQNAATIDEILRRQAWERYGVRRSLKKLWDAEDLPDSLQRERMVRRERERRRGMPIYFGWGVAALLLLGATAPSPRLTKRRSVGPVRHLAWVALILLALATWPGARLLDGSPGLARLMFPWRLLSPATGLAVLAGGLALRGRSWAPIALIVLLAWDAAPFLGAAERLPEPETSGFSVFGGDDSRSIDLPRDRFIRIEDAPLPPTDYGWQLSYSRWIFTEYMAPQLRQRYGLLSQAPSVQESSYFGVSHRFSRTSLKHQRLEPSPVVLVGETGGAGPVSWEPVEPSRWSLRPEAIEVRLEPSDEPRQLLLKWGWFPGWEWRAEDGPWRSLEPTKDKLMRLDVPPGAASISLRYSWLRPWHRAAGLMVSLTALLGLGFFLRLRSRTADSARGTGQALLPRDEVP